MLIHNTLHAYRTRFNYNTLIDVFPTPHVCLMPCGLMQLDTIYRIPLGVDDILIGINLFVTKCMEIHLDYQPRQQVHEIK